MFSAWNFVNNFYCAGDERKALDGQYKNGSSNENATNNLFI